jgi:hypothetical protein
MINLNPERIAFVNELGELLRKAKPHLVKCELKLGSEIAVSAFMPRVHPAHEYVVVTTENGYTYNICVEANNLAAIALDIFKAMTHK